MRGSFKRLSCERKEGDKVVARGGRSSEGFVLFSLVVEDKKDLRVFFKPGEKQRGKEGGREQP